MLNRRQFIKKAAGFFGVMAAMSAPVLGLNRVLASHPDAEKTRQDLKHQVGPGVKSRAWSMIIDLKKCEGCVTIDAPPQCMQACIVGMYVPKGQLWIEVFKVGTPGGSFYMPTPCFQCENAPCVNICPVGATYHTPDGIVLIDAYRCIGCRLCMSACPYARRFFNWGTPELPAEAKFKRNTPEHPIPAIKGTVIKCEFCAHLLRDGTLPFCVTGCPMRALYMGDFNEDIASNGTEVVKLSKFLAENDAFRYKEALGTRPRVWYLPGHGQAFGRRASDPRELKPNEWTWGDKGYDRTVDIWPWAEKVPWTWEEPPK